MTNFKIFLTNLGKYNEGHLVGKWIDLPCDDLEAELESIGVVEGTQYEEYFITDYENDFGYKVGEHDDLEELNDLAEQLEDIDDRATEHLEAYLEATGVDLVEALASYEVSIFYKDMDMEAVAYELVEEGEFGKVPSQLKNYIDYVAIANDLECGSYFKVSNGVILI